jgi:hypothetical protein
MVEFNMAVDITKMICHGDRLLVTDDSSTSLGITYIALAISDQRGILSCCLRLRRHQPKLRKIVRRKTRSITMFLAEDLDSVIARKVLVDNTSIVCLVSAVDSDGVIARKLPVDEDYWKNHVIVGCTIAVAVEVVIVVLMVMYWRQIRWTLRKLTCPCVSHSFILHHVIIASS